MFNKISCDKQKTQINSSTNPPRRGCEHLVMGFNESEQQFNNCPFSFLLFPCLKFYVLSTFHFQSLFNSYFCKLIFSNEINA